MFDGFVMNMQLVISICYACGQTAAGVLGQPCVVWVTAWSPAVSIFDILYQSTTLQWHYYRHIYKIDLSCFHHAYVKSWHCCYGQKLDVYCCMYGIISAGRFQNSKPLY